jgi:hypothetical protein
MSSLNANLTSATNTNMASIIQNTIKDLQNQKELGTLISKTDNKSKVS